MKITLHAPKKRIAQNLHYLLKKCEKNNRVEILDQSKMENQQGKLQIFSLCLVIKNLDGPSYLPFLPALLTITHFCLYD